MNIEYFKKKNPTKINRNLFFNKDCHSNKKKILIYQNQDFHSEISGTIIYHFLNVDFYIFYPNKDSINNCFSYYEKIFNIKINYVNNISESEYDYIFVLTSREIKFLTPNVKSKYILFKHVNEDESINGYINISLTPLVTANFYTIPIYNILNNNTRFNVICVIGNMSCDKIRDLNGLFKLMDELKDFNFYIFTRKIKEDYKILYSKQKNCKVYLNVNTENMIEKIRKSKYIFTADTPYYSENGFKTGVLTGMIPLALNNNVPLILSKKLNNIYKLSGVIEYGNSVEVVELINKLDEGAYNTLLNSFLQTKQKILSENKLKFDKIIK